MGELLSQLPNTLLGWASLTIALAFSIVLAYLAFTRQRDGADDRLIKILQGTVNELDKKVTALEIEQETLVKQIAELKTTNETLTKILQGRDETTLSFQKEVKEAIQLGKDTNDLARSTNAAVQGLADILTKHYKMA